MSFKAGPSVVNAAPWRFVPAAVPEWEPPRHPPQWLALDRHSARPFKVNRADAEEAACCLRSLGGDRFGLELADDLAYEVRCGRRAWMILFNRECLQAESVGRLAKHKATPVAIASRSEQTGEYSISYLALSSPGEREGEVQLSIFRTTGRLAFGGAARIAGECASFSIHAVSRPGAFAIELAGRFEARSLVIETALSSPGIVVPKREPVADS
jgi:hypothetical protein